MYTLDKTWSEIDAAAKNGVVMIGSAIPDFEGYGFTYSPVYQVYTFEENSSLNYCVMVGTDPLTSLTYVTDSENGYPVYDGGYIPT